MKQSLAIGLVLFLSGCHGPKSPETLRKEQCEHHPESVEVYLGGSRATRPYRVLTEVDALWFASKAARTRTLQVKACQLRADAVIDVTEQPYSVREKLAITPWGAFAVREVTPGPQQPGLGLAIRYDHDVPSPADKSSTPPSTEPTPTPPAPAPIDTNAVPPHVPRW